MKKTLALPLKKKALLTALILGLFLIGWQITRSTTVSFLSGSDFNVYLFRYLYHSHFFRQQLLYTILVDLPEPVFCFLPVGDHTYLRIRK